MSLSSETQSRGGVAALCPVGPCRDGVCASWDWEQYREYRSRETTMAARQPPQQPGASLSRAVPVMWRMLWLCRECPVITCHCSAAVMTRHRWGHQVSGAGILQMHTNDTNQRYGPKSFVRARGTFCVIFGHPVTFPPLSTMFVVLLILFTPTPILSTTFCSTSPFFSVPTLSIFLMMLAQYRTILCTLLKHKK